MTIIEYTKSMKAPLADMMADYMAELDCDVPPEIIRGKLSDFIDSQVEKGIIRVCMAYAGDEPIAFSIFQIDTAESDWCKRPGWGFIREYYVVPGHRKSGVGRELAAYTEQELKNMGATQLYLTSTDAVPFWRKCGWRLTDELSSNGLYILEKEVDTYGILDGASADRGQTAG